MTNTKKIYSSKIAGMLCRKGFKIIGTEPNPRKPWLDVFIFEQNGALTQAFDEILTSIKSNQQ